jgi:type II secretory pathway pseudopilin PulG
VELLVVIGIIAVLISLLLPVVSKARAQTNRTACQSNVRQLYVGILNYCNDNHDWYPTCAYPTFSPSWVQYPDDWLYWEANRNLDDSPVAKYLRLRGEALKSLLRCPADTFDDRKPLATMTKAEQTSQGPYLYSYGINNDIGENLIPPQNPGRTKRNQWRRPSTKILFSEDLNQQPNLYTQAVWNWTAKLTRHHGVGKSKQTHLPMGINVTAGFMDGHVAPIDDEFSSDIANSIPTP